MRMIITTLLLCMGSSVFSQINFVMNPDFEQYSFCPRGFDDFRAVKNWTGIDSTGLKNCDVIDYCHTCASVGSNVNIPQGKFFYQSPHSGNAFNAVTFYVNDGSHNVFARHYLQGRLSKKLTAGKQYCVSYFVSLAEGSKYAIKELGAYLDNGIIDTATICGAPQTKYIPQIANSGGMITDTINWVKIEGSFIAKGNEEFITIGNFKDDANTTTVSYPTTAMNSCCPYYAWYLVDDVSVVESDLKADAGPDTHVGYGDSVYIGRPMSSAVWGSWTVLGSSIIMGQGPGIWVKPATTTSYVVSQTLCGNTKKDTVQVEVWAAGITSIYGKSQAYTLAPNPSEGKLHVSQAIEDRGRVALIIYDALGRIAFQSAVTFDDKASSIDLGNVTSGMYYMVIHDSAGTTYSLKFVKK